MENEFRVAVGLLHYPILDGNKKLVATNITNFDIHDISRACTVYGIQNYFIIHPIREQLMFVERVLDHWRTGEGSRYNSSRKTSLEIAQTAESLEDALNKFDPNALVYGTHAHRARRPLEIMSGDSKDHFH